MVPAALLIVIVAAVVFIGGYLAYEATLGKHGRQIEALQKNEAEDRKKLEELREFFETVILGHADEARLKSAIRRIYSNKDFDDEVEFRIKQRVR